jgi:hypothetical protein
MITRKENMDPLIKIQFDVAKLSNDLTDIIAMKNRIENGYIEDNVIKEWLDIRKEFVNCKAELKEMLENKEILFRHPTVVKLNWLMVNYIYGNVERLKRIVENDIDTLPKNNEILYNSIDSQFNLIDFLIKKDGIEKWKDRIEKDNLLFPESNSTKAANTAFNRINEDKKTKTLPIIVALEKQKEFLTIAENFKNKKDDDKWNSKQVQAFYSILHKSFIIKQKNDFNEVKRQMNEYFDTGEKTGYKPVQLSDTEEKLKKKYNWIDVIIPREVKPLTKQS